jgi:hypothetical protein
MLGRGNRITRRKPAPVPLCPPQTPHAGRTRTRAAAVGSQRLTAELRHGLSVNRLSEKMWEHRCLTTLWAFTACYRHSFNILEPRAGLVSFLIDSQVSPFSYVPTMKETKRTVIRNGLRNIYRKRQNPILSNYSNIYIMGKPSGRTAGYPVPDSHRGTLM